MIPVPTGAGSISDSQEVSRRGWIFASVAVALCAGGYVAYGLVANEVRTSQWQAHYLGRVTRQLSFDVQSGASDSIRFPHSGPYDARLGYGRMPDFTERLTQHGYVPAEQARMSPAMVRLIERLSADLTHRFGRGFSRQNLWQMRAFHLAWPATHILQTLSGESAKPGLLQTPSGESTAELIRQSPSAMISRRCRRRWKNSRSISRSASLATPMPDRCICI